MSGETPAAEHETEKERVDRELIEFLNEVRIVLPGRRVLPESATATAPFQAPTAISPTRGDTSMDATSAGADNR